MPFPQFTGVTVQGDNIGYSNQHVVTFTIQKRLSAGVQSQTNAPRSFQFAVRFKW